MVRPQYAVRCIAGRHKDKWANCDATDRRGSRLDRPAPWCQASVCRSRIEAAEDADYYAEQYGGKWRVVPVPEPEVSDGAES